MKTYGEWKYNSTIPDLSTRWRRVISFTPRLLYPQRNSSCPQWIGGCFGPRADLDAMEKKTSVKHGDSGTHVKYNQFLTNKLTKIK
jgi:hypothetical protein